MYRKRYKLRRFLTIFAFLSLSGRLFCQEPEQSLLSDIDLGKASYSWLSVKSGKSLCRPARTSYGWLDLTDGKMVSAISESGKVVWQKGLPYSPLPLISVAPGDFSYVALRNKKVCLLNHSGLVLWQRAVDFEPVWPVLPGRDGRAFVFGKTEAACLGINGILKWRQKIEPLSQSLAPVQANDGSVLAFLEALVDGKTAALRFSPFGDLLERIVFAGKVVGAASTDGGALLAFDDGSLGLCEVQSGEAKSKWVIKGAAFGSKVLFGECGSPGKIAVASCSGGGTKVAAIDLKKAEATLVFDVPEIKSLEYFSCPRDGFFAASADFAAIHSSGGKRVRGVKFPPKAKGCDWDYVLYGNSGAVIFTCKNWDAVGYKVLKAAPPSAKAPAPSQKNYKAFYQGQSEDFARIRLAAGIARKEALQAGNYGPNEKLYLFDNDRIVGDWIQKTLSKNSVGDSATVEQEELFAFSLSESTAAIGMLGLFGGAEQSKTLAKILSLSSDESVLLPALKAVQDCGYDPSGALIGSIELLIKNAQASQEALLRELCAALYSVCRFMGRPAINSRGMKLLSTLQLPQYPKSARDNARKIYEKLAELKI